MQKTWQTHSAELVILIVAHHETLIVLTVKVIGHLRSDATALELDTFASVAILSAELDESSRS